jgi:hypothetical protein
VSKYLNAALVLAAISVVAAVLVLGLILVNPFEVAADASAGERANVVSAIAAVSAAVSTVIALAIGAIAVIALIVSEKSETRAIEQLKLDVAAMASTLISIRDRALLYTNVGAVNWAGDPFRPEREALTRILTSSTGWAIHAWSHTKGNEKFDEVYPTIAGLVDVTTLDLNRNTQAIVNLLAERAVHVFDQLCAIEERDFRRMSETLSRLSDGISEACAILQTDRLGELQRMMTTAHLETYRAPTEAEVQRAAELASEGIGGEAGKTVQELGSKAMTGTPEDRRLFHRLVEQLLGTTLDELGQSSTDPSAAPQTPPTPPAGEA